MDDQGENFRIKVSGNLHSSLGSVLITAAQNGSGIFIGPTFMMEKAVEEGTLETVLDRYTPMTTGLYVYTHRANSFQQRYGLLLISSLSHGAISDLKMRTGNLKANAMHINTNMNFNTP